MLNYFTVYTSVYFYVFVCVDWHLEFNESLMELQYIYITTTLIHQLRLCWNTTFGGITNLPFLSLGELRKNGTWEEATLLPLREACKIEEKERDKRESRCPV